MKCRTQSFSELGRWAHLWDDRLKSGLRTRDFRQLRALGFEVDKTSFQLCIIRRKVKPQHSWAARNDSIQRVLLTAFPKLVRNESQRRRAGRWARVIQLYFQMGLSYAEVGQEIKEKPGTVMTLIRSISRVAGGRTANGADRRKRVT